jgi:hypothetical protein
VTGELQPKRNVARLSRRSILQASLVFAAIAVSPAAAATAASFDAKAFADDRIRANQF